MNDPQIQMDITKVMLFANGTTFGEVGPYEILKGRIHYNINPTDDLYESIVDLRFAPRNSDGKVSYSSDIYILKPVHLERSNRRIIYDVNNRGDKRILQFFNDAVHSNTPYNEDHAGNGFLMRRGYTIVWSGWQGDILCGDGRLTMSLPIAKDGDSDITGIVRTEFISDTPNVTLMPLSASDYTKNYEPVSIDTRLAKFTMREYETDIRKDIANKDWLFCQGLKKLDTEYTPTYCHFPQGFKPGWIYELIYQAKNPMVMGLGFTAVRDLVSFLLNEPLDSAGFANPLFKNGVGMDKAYAWGRSQSGRFLREFIYSGFNVDTKGRQVFQGISPHVSGCGRIALNHRFSQPGRFPRTHNDHLYPSDQFPFSYNIISDSLTGETDGILKRPDTDPFVIHTQTSSEYWERRGSLVHTDSDGNDLAGHPKVRIFLFSSSQHSADPLGGPTKGHHLHISNPLNTSALLRALLDSLDAWASHNMPPPESRVPRTSDHTAVKTRNILPKFPKIPGVCCPHNPNRLYVQDHGSTFRKGILSVEPPREIKSKEYVVLVPQIDIDGNDLAGVRSPEIEVPLATYTGWNFRPYGSAPHTLAGIIGSFFPFPKNNVVKNSTGDSRPSIEERYPKKTDYVDSIQLSAQNLVDAGLLLEEDAERYLTLAIRTVSYW